ncbi:MAG: DUF5615 family PIN-like protein [Acidimicrobiia bacterium]
MQLLSEHGHDVATVSEEGLIGAPDRLLAEAAKSEDRILITLDRGLLTSAVTRQELIPASSWCMPGICVPGSASCSWRPFLPSASPRSPSCLGSGLASGSSSTRKPRDAGAPRRVGLDVGLPQHADHYPGTRSGR